ncbi:septum formation initiator family protein [Actinotalea sp. JY-7876]|uniref:FtsB family cell division protein n=2 Tax=unclassified Actinotalea TaxID=2638618 RepID=UPI002105C54A|nr:septum formation initiator family protein [Actinotalea sp. JY-7876]
MSRRPSLSRALRGRAPASGTATGAAAGRGRGAPARPARSGRRPAADRPAQRPGSVRPPSGRAVRTEEDDEPRPLHLARLISVRALVLSVVLLVGFTMLFPTLRAYLAQQAELDALAREVAAAEQAEEDLAAERDRWADPAYVEAQARDRLNYVHPDETSYRVIDPETVVETPLQSATHGPVAGPALPAGGAVAPWYATVWESVQLAGDAPVPDPEASEPLPGEAAATATEQAP